jgi:hypothetical protein
LPAGGDGAEGSKGKASTIDSVVFSEANIVKQRQFNYKIKVIYYGAASSAGSRGGNAGKGGVGGLGGFGGMALITSISAPYNENKKLRNSVTYLFFTFLKILFLDKYYFWTNSRIILSILSKF